MERGGGIEMNFKYNGIILFKNDIGETDRLYGIYTLEAGKIRARAIGVKKPNAKLAGNLEPLTYSEIFMARGRGKGNITGVIALNNFSGIKSGIEATQKVFYTFGIFGRLVTEEEKDEKIFSLLLEYLEAMDRICVSSSQKSQEGRLDIVTLGFLFKFLGALGYKIEADKCVKCGTKLQPDGNYFSAESGGVVCVKCGSGSGKKVKIIADSIKLIRLFLKNKVGNFGKIEAEKSIINNLKVIISEEIGWITG